MLLADMGRCIIGTSTCCHPMIGQEVAIKTTIDISDPLLQEARRVAARNGVTIRSLVEQGLRKVLAERPATAPFRLRDASVDGKGLSEAWQAGSWDRIRDASYGITDR